MRVLTSQIVATRRRLCGRRLLSNSPQSGHLRRIRERDFATQSSQAWTDSLFFQGLAQTVTFGDNRLLREVAPKVWN